MSTTHKHNLRSRTKPKTAAELRTGETSTPKSKAPRRKNNQRTKQKTDPNPNLTRSGDGIDASLFGTWQTPENVSRDQNYMPTGSSTVNRTTEQPTSLAATTNNSIPPAWELKIDTLIKAFHLQNTKVAELEKTLNKVQNGNITPTSNSYANQITSPLSQPHKD